MTGAMPLSGPPKTGRSAVFLDRDGVLNVNHGYVGHADHLEWVSGALDALALLTACGYQAFVVTNQSGVARGYYSESDVVALHETMQRQIVEAGGRIQAFAYCPHHPEAVDPRYRLVCDCRKPGPGMLLRLIEEFGILRSGSFMIGDKLSDLAAAQAAGIDGYLFSGGSLLTFVEALLRSRSRAIATSNEEAGTSAAS